MKRNSKFVLFFLILSIFISNSFVKHSISTTSTPGSRRQYNVVPININVVNGTDIDEATIKANIARMNEIYNCEVIIFVWNGTINILPDPDGPNGNPDGFINNTDKNIALKNREMVRGNASQGNPKGISITITNGLAPNVNGFCIINEPHSAIVRKGTNGDTWAHEIMHALGLSHGSSQPANEDINGDAPGNGTGWDVNGDGKIDNKDRDYILWGRASDRTNTNMTETQHNTVYNESAKLPGVRNKTRPVITPQKKENGLANSGITKVDDINDTSQYNIFSDSADLIKISAIFESDENLLNVRLTISNFPNESSQYTIFFDSPSISGDPLLDGADLAINYTHTPGNPNDFNANLIMWDPGWTPLQIINVPIIPLEETVDADNDTGSWIDESFFDVFFDLQIDNPDFISRLLEGQITMWAISNHTDSNTTDSTTKIEGSFIPISYPVISVNQEDVDLGSQIEIVGDNFAPESIVRIYLDDIEIGSTTSNATGSIQISVGLPNDINGYNRVLKTQDSIGNIDAIYLNIFNPEDTSSSTDTDTTSQSMDTTTTNESTDTSDSTDSNTDDSVNNLENIDGYSSIGIIGIAILTITIRTIKKKENN